MRLSKLSYLTLWAVHFDEAKKLYKDTLGLPVAQENENFVMFYSSLRSKGVMFDEPPANRPWGTRSAGFKDPEGYVVEIVGPLKPGEPSRGN